MNLSITELNTMISYIFPGYPEDKILGILVDIPESKKDDNDSWKKRRAIVSEWYTTLRRNISLTKLTDVHLIAYPSVDSDNADLPEYAYVTRKLPTVVDKFISEEKKPFTEIFNEIPLFLAPTEKSATAPLKIAAKKYKFRAATMPRFSEKMIPALKIDYYKVAQRVIAIKERLDRAISAEVSFVVENKNEYTMLFDLRYRTAFSSHGKFPGKGMAGNLPSGEAYIVPYEGERGEQSLTQGVLPVQINNDILLFTVKNNRAFEIKNYFQGFSECVKSEDEHLKREPAYGNISELGFGVLQEFGIQPIDELLLDEKLGFHIGFGRSDHFGGITGAKDFSSMKEVVHLDRIYIPQTQPDITIPSIILVYPEKNNTSRETIMVDGRLCL